MSEVSNPYTRMLATFDPRRFYGRESELALILQGISAHEPNSFSITGIRTIGKTTLLKYLAHGDGAARQHEGYLGKEYIPGGQGALHFTYQSFHGFKRGEDVFHLLVQQMQGEALELPVDNHLLAAGEHAGKQELVDTIYKILEQMAQGKNRLVFLLDDFGPVIELMDEEDDGLLRTLTKLAPFVIATETPMSELRPELVAVSPLFNILVPRAIGLLSEEAARKLVVEPAEEVGVFLTNEEVEFLLEIAGRQPFLLTAACEQLFDLRMKIDDFERMLVARRDQFRRQFMTKLGGQPHVAEAFLRFWTKLNLQERECLFEITLGAEPDAGCQRTALQSLQNKALICEDFERGGYRVFSTLFAAFFTQRYDTWREERRRPSSADVQQLAETLPPLDRKLLLYLIENSSQMCSFDELLREVWEDPQTSKRALEAAVHRLRKSLELLDESTWEYIKNVRGKGYQFVSPWESSP